MTDLKHVTYCGLYCGLCLNAGRIPRRAGELRDLLRKVSVEEWGPELPGYAEFWQFLQRLADFGAIASCRGKTCGPDVCAIRDCASGKGFDACPFCGEYPCERIRALGKRYVTLIGDGERMREVGIDRWVAEQKARQEGGSPTLTCGRALPRRSGSRPHRRSGGPSGGETVAVAADRLDRGSCQSCRDLVAGGVELGIFSTAASGRFAKRITLSCVSSLLG